MSELGLVYKVPAGDWKDVQAKRTGPHTYEAVIPLLEEPGQILFYWADSLFVQEEGENAVPKTPQELSEKQDAQALGLPKESPSLVP